MSRPQDDARWTARMTLASLARSIRLTRWAIALERAAVCFWPVFSWVLILLAVLRSGILTRAPQELAWAGTAVGGIGLLSLSIWGARQFRMPNRDDAISRIDSKLPGRPLAALGDTHTIGAGDQTSAQLWSRHLERMARAARLARVTRPHVRLSSRDPWAFRLTAIFLCAAALIFSRTNPVQSLVDSLSPDEQQIATGPSFEAWIEPPSYTRKPTVYLNELADGTNVRVPQGAQVLLRIYGGSDAVTLNETVSGAPQDAPEPSDTSVSERIFAVTQSGTVSVDPNRSTALSWGITMIPDAAPSVSLDGEITRTVEGAMQLPFSAKDDYGVVGGDVKIELDLAAVDRRFGLALAPETRPGPTLELPLPFKRDTTDFTEILIEDLSKHPWVGLPVVLDVAVRDDLEQPGRAGALAATLPGRRFFDKMAAALVEQRRDLLWTRQNADRVALVLRAMVHLPEGLFDHEEAYTLVQKAIRRLEHGIDTTLSVPVQEEVAELLWQAALKVEDGDLSDARERLRRAQDRLNDAMENGATDGEIADLMDELRRATQDYLRQLAQEQNQQGDNTELSQQNGNQITQDQLQQMMDRIQELMEQGRMDEAQELMQQLQQMMENMRVTQGQGGEGQQGNNPMEGLGETLRDQQDLADETYRDLQEQFNQRRQQGQQQNGQQQGQQQGQGQGEGQNRGQGQGQQMGENGTQPGQRPGQGGSGAGGQDPRSLAERQQALRDMLEAQRGDIPNDGSELGRGLADSLDRAEEGMGRAERNLQSGNNQQALDDQAEAMEALREGMRQLSEMQSQSESEIRNGQGQQAGSAGGQRDPLGRPLSRVGQIGSDDTAVPDEVHRRSKEVLDEIRRRSAERARPQVELDYLDRLLERF